MKTDADVKEEAQGQLVFGKGQMGSALMGSLHFLFFFDRDFLGTPVNSITFIFPKVPGRTFPNLSKFITFAGAPFWPTSLLRLWISEGLTQA